jgi:hypothetical protein
LNISETKQESDIEEAKVKLKESNVTPKPGHGFDVHNTTIMEENETIRASMEKTGLHKKKRMSHFGDEVPISVNPH